MLTLPGIEMMMQFVGSGKGQMKIQQMAFMLMAVTLFFVLAGMFILVFRFATLKESATTLEEKNALLLVTKIANSPEFSCGNSFGGGKIDCVDLDKVMALKGNIDKYDDFWGKDVSNIEIRQIYPTGRESLCESDNYPDCNVIKVFSKEVTGNYLSNYVVLCRKEGTSKGIYDKCNIR